MDIKKFIDEYALALAQYEFMHERISEYMAPGIARYVVAGVIPGGFATSILSNDLVGAIGKADFSNIRIIHVYAALLYNRLPTECWGSRKLVEEWHNKGGLVGAHENISERNLRVILRLEEK